MPYVSFISRKFHFKAASCRAVIPDASGMINPEKIREQITAVKRQLDVFQQLMTDAKSELDMAKMEEESQVCAAALQGDESRSAVPCLA